MTLRCLEPSGNGADRTRSQWGTSGSPEEQSPEATRLAKALRELSQTGWYWGSMTVNEAKEKLKEAPEGTFLIRDSSHSDYLLTISVKTSAGPTNLRIEYQDGKFRLDSIICVKSKLKQFDSVVHLVDYYVQMCKDKRTGPEAPRNGTVHLYLTKPLYTSAPTLQHFCRLAINKCTGAIWGLPLPTRLKDYLEEYKFQENQVLEILTPSQPFISGAQDALRVTSPTSQLSILNIFPFHLATFHLDTETQDIFPNTALAVAIV
ncbi:suppressor of cytokine signaling 2 isoform X1 [Mastomys coucha]|uniref:suppressor of cytokine signaling 2 isoform X1 n=1 Tax=Mastomys coucha TaxID=35658 RepID=UPI001262776A|nr:suppressor of cytokine signaling 2 isoform X1 [Mastomys coucha]XP_031205339.1 suppressor of cytokine signaling 2 isoform X1 [Mastomys coucha]XP_031205340.1 suppressor of cytokine signaling 2 isoform X1 [Mastomys coucha]XP_031205341.1 suppressor of cytokine signaling 2 isoform X1 [Mastomys coucha]